jgi:hypothetical protein
MKDDSIWGRISRVTAEPVEVAASAADVPVFSTSDSSSIERTALEKDAALLGAFAPIGKFCSVVPAGLFIVSAFCIGKAYLAPDVPRLELFSSEPCCTSICGEASEFSASSTESIVEAESSGSFCSASSGELFAISGPESDEAKSGSGISLLWEFEL